MDIIDANTSTDVRNAVGKTTTAEKPALSGTHATAGTQCKIISKSRFYSIRGNRDLNSKRDVYNSRGRFQQQQGR
jgi:hypothetical protein